MPIRRFKERAEFLALRIIVTQALIETFDRDARSAKRFADDVDRVIDTFEFTDGWADSDVTRGREYLRMASDRILRPVIDRVRGR